MLRSIVIILVAVMLVLLSACNMASKEDRTAQVFNANEEQTSHFEQEIIPIGIDFSSIEMNNYMQGSGTFAQDKSSVYFEDNYYAYILDKETGKLEKTLRSSLENYTSFYYSAIIAEGTVFSSSGGIWGIENPAERWRICSNVSFNGSNLFTYSNGPVLPHGNNIYYLYIPIKTQDESAMILRGSIWELEATDQTITINDVPWKYLELANVDVVLQKDGLESFGIYNNHIVAMTQNADIWVTDIKSGESSRIVDGEDIRRGAGEKYYVVDGDYIYFKNDNEDKIERILFDGSGREIIRDQLSGVAGDQFNCAEGFLYYIDYDKESGESYLFRTDLNNPTLTTILATGDDEGISLSLTEKLYIIDDWIYYQSVKSGYWRSKIDGSRTELITYAAIDENSLE